MKELVRQCRHHNVFPIFLPNAYWDSSPPAVFKVLERLVDTHIESLECLDADDLATEVRAMPIQLQEWLGDTPEDHHDREYLQRFSLYWMAASIDGDYCDFKSALAPMASDSEVAQRFPELFDELDDEGLITLDDRFTLMDGGIAYKEHVLHFHQCLRRGFGSNPNYDFLARLAAYYRKTKETNEFKIAIDPRRVMHLSDYQRTMEADAWFGALFDPADIDNHDAVGLTVIERERPSLFDMSLRIDRTEFFWSSDRKSNLKTFEIEEILAESVKFDAYHINRYVHAERDTANHVLRHFDGAAKVYTDGAAYAERYGTSIPHEPRASMKPKLFRIDGDIELEDWIDLVSFFMRGNEMVLRYFDSGRYERAFREKIEEWKTIREPPPPSS